MASISPDSLIGKVSTMSPNGVQDVPSLYTPPYKGEGNRPSLRLGWCYMADSLPQG